MDMWSGWGGSVFGALGGAIIGVVIAVVVMRKTLKEQRVTAQAEMKLQAQANSEALASANAVLERTLVFQAFGVYLSGVLGMNDGVERGPSEVRSAHRVAMAGGVQLEVALQGRYSDFVQLSQQIVDRMLRLGIAAASQGSDLRSQTINRSELAHAFGKVIGMTKQWILEPDRRRDCEQNLRQSIHSLDEHFPA